MKRYFAVVDTSYLLELLRVPGHHSEDGHLQVRTRFDKASRDSAWSIIVPTACIYECCNFIAQCNDGNKRYEIGVRLFEIVERSIKPMGPLTIPESLNSDGLLMLCHEFQSRYVMLGIGLTDASVIQEARRLSGLYRAREAVVYIWTTDKELKAYEPDNEPDAYCG